MKKLLFLLLVFFSFNLFGQSAGDYGSAGSGGWGTDGSNWLVFVSSSDWSDATPAPGAPTASTNVWIRAGHTDSLNAAVITCNNLNIAGSLLTCKTTSTAMQVNGNLTIQASGVFKAQSNTLGITSTGGLVSTIDLKGDFTNNGTAMDFRVGSAGSSLGCINLTLSGTTSCTISSPTAYSSTNGDFNGLTINKTNGAKVILGSNIVVDGGSTNGPSSANSIVTFVNGLIETGNYLFISLSSAEASVTGYSSASYVKGNMGRGMSTTAGATKNFPVGDANAFRLINLRSTTSGSATGQYAIVKCVSGDANQAGSVYTNGIDRVSHIRYFKIGYNNTGAGAANMSFDRFEVSYGADDGVIAGNTNLKVAYSIDSMATWNGILQSTPHTTIIAASDPQTIIVPDALTTPINVLAGGSSIFVALADTAGGANPLPVELTSFTAAYSSNSVNLSWSTATELSNNGYDVEKRIAGIPSWEKIGFVKGAGTSNSRNNYSFSDKGSFVSGTYQYRLKQNDLNGNFTYSNIVEVEIVQPKEYSLNQNFPNPFNPSTTIEYALPKAGNVELTVFNSIGQEVSRLINNYQESGNYSVHFNANNLSTGIYFYRLKTNDYVSIKKMILIK